MHFTDDNGDVIASDTFEVPAQGKFYVAGIEVHEDVYRRVEQAWAERHYLADRIVNIQMMRWANDREGQFTPEEAEDAEHTYRDRLEATLHRTVSA